MLSTSDVVRTQTVQPTPEDGDLWIISVTDDENGADNKPLTAGNRIECREGCGW
jgi:hypothetical protein